MRAALRRELLHFRGIRRISGRNLNRVALFREFILQATQAISAAGRCHHTSAFPSKQDGSLAANSARSAYDKRNLAF
jgi:hypothetical protein